MASHPGVPLDDRGIPRSKLLGYVWPDAKFTMNTRGFYTAQELQRDVMAAGLQIRSRRGRPVLPAAPWWSPGGSWTGMSEIRLSFVIPARNEEALIGEALEAILASVARASGISRNDLWLPDTSFEVIVADDGSEDTTAAIVRRVAGDVACDWCLRGRTCAAARNAGAAASLGRVLCFVDADTIVPETAVDRILKLHEDEGSAGSRLARGRPGSEPGSGGGSGAWRDASLSRGRSRCRRS